MGKYIQVNDANWRILYIGGWCEGYVEGAWGRASLPKQNSNGEWYTSGIYSSAKAAWDAEPNKHYDLPPEGITVPVYFSLGSTSQGHVAIRLDDLKVASSTQGGVHNQGYLHPNINDLVDMYAKYNSGCQYLGWGEHVGGMRVVQWQDDTVYATPEQIQQAYQEILERPADQDGINHYVKYTIDFVRQDLASSQEYRDLQARKAAAQTPPPEVTTPPVEVPPVETPIETQPDTPVEPTVPQQPETPTEPQPPKEENMELTPEQEKSLYAVAATSQNLISDVAGGDEAQELTKSISQKTKLIFYMIGDALIVLAGVLPLTAIAIISNDPLVKINAASGALAFLGTAILTFFGIYKSGK